MIKKTSVVTNLLLPMNWSEKSAIMAMHLYGSDGAMRYGSFVHYDSCLCFPCRERNLHSQSRSMSCTLTFRPNYSSQDLISSLYRKPWQREY